MTRVGLYACTTAADLGATVFDEKLPELRRYASIREWEVAGEFTDASPTGNGRRPDFERLCAEISAGKLDVVLANAIHDLFWDLTQIGRFAEPWSRAGIRLVCVRNSFDATTPEGWRDFVYCASFIDEWRRGRQRERQRIGVLRAQLHAAGAPLAGRPRVIVSPFEVKAGYERGLSHREIVALIRKSGSRVSKWKVGACLEELRETGQLDETRRAEALVKRGGACRGGRQRPAGRPLTDQETADAWHSGATVPAIVERLKDAGASVSRKLLQAKVAALRSRGMIDDGLRAEAKAKVSGRAA